MRAQAYLIVCMPAVVPSHIINASGLSGVSGPISFTGGQMLLTLKLISMAVCYQDAHTKPSNVSRSYVQQQQQ
jgi:hypothetical protein